METVHPHSLALVTAMGQALESQLRRPHRGRNAVARATRPERSPTPTRPVLMLDVLGRDRADVRVQGRRLALSQRHSEILVLLAAHPRA